MYNYHVIFYVMILRILIVALICSLSIGLLIDFSIDLMQYSYGADAPDKMDKYNKELDKLINTTTVHEKLP
jgi:hypothetical protein